ncbi:MAG TPA: hypothetical protein PKJ37_09925, partial [Acidobacteriota bacterium]|nr:hypothetical protein [Acidobacteriota bacterium]HNT18195.1 hypothetical protein [Acidobacteriota bacterium]
SFPLSGATFEGARGSRERGKERRMPVDSRRRHHEMSESEKGEVRGCGIAPNKNGKEQPK